MALSLGAVRFFEKPVNTEEFLFSVVEVLTQGSISLPPLFEVGNFHMGSTE